MATLSTKYRHRLWALRLSNAWKRKIFQFSSGVSLPAATALLDALSHSRTRLVPLGVPNRTPPKQSPDPQTWPCRRCDRVGCAATVELWIAGHRSPEEPCGRRPGPGGHAHPQRRSSAVKVSWTCHDAGRSLRRTLHGPLRRRWPPSRKLSMATWPTTRRSP
jgi:hypothetical protein